MGIEWNGILFVALIMISALITIKIIEKKANLSGELKRKLFHITMGIVVLTFPYLFHNRNSVVIIGVISILMFIIMKHTKLKQSIGSILYSVDRESWGEIFFTVSVVLIFYWSKGEKITYSIPILILTFADSVAALVGKKYGTNNLAQFNEDKKSIEGSCMFFIVAFMLTLIPLLLYTEVGRREVLIISAIVGFNVSLVEMIAHSGNDNLLIPLTTYAFLTTYIGQDFWMLKKHLIILGIIFILVNIANRVKIWSKLALVEALVVGYLTIILYGSYAIIPPLILFLTCMRFPKMIESEKENLYDARIIETNVLAGLSICIIANTLCLKKELFMIYSLCYSMHLSINTFVRLKYYFNFSENKSMILAFVKGLFFIFLPSILIEFKVFQSTQIWYMLIIEIILLFMSCKLICYKKSNVQTEEISIQNGYLHMKIVGVLISIMLLIEFLIDYVWIL